MVVFIVQRLLTVHDNTDTAFQKTHGKTLQHLNVIIHHPLCIPTPDAARECDVLQVLDGGLDGV